MTRSERIHKSNSARVRRKEVKGIRILRTLNEWARQHRERLKHKKRLRSQTHI